VVTTTLDSHRGVDGTTSVAQSLRAQYAVSSQSLLNRIKPKAPMTMKNAAAICSIILLAAACAPSNPGTRAAPAAASARVITNGNGLIAAMHDRYENTWYKTLRFRQTVTLTRAGKEQPPEVWLEHAVIPGYLRIDQAHDYNGNGVIYAPDSVYSFRNGKLARVSKGRNPLMVLGFDVYRQPAATSLRVLQEEGYDFTKFRMDTWQGKPVYVVGADAGDLHSKQFWIEQDRLLFVRAMEPSGAGGKQTTEYQFNNYQPLGKGWIAVKCVFLRDGVEFDREEYFDIEGDPKLPQGIMDPAQWATALVKK
jgi:hypothetical protein